MKYTEILKAIPHMSDIHLNALIKFSTEELTKRTNELEEARRTWIERMYKAFISHPNASSRVRGKLTIVAAYDYYSVARIGTAFPIKGDAFDEETGIAVAFAKAIGEPVPDFV